MIWTVFQVNLRRLLNNRIELLLTFVVPIAFFSVFAVIFGGGVGTGKTPKIKVIVLDEVDSPLSRNVVRSLKESAGFRWMRDELPRELDANGASELVRRGTVTLAIVLTGQEDSVAVDLLTDASDQVAGQVAMALVSQSLLVARAEQLQADASGVGPAASEGDPLAALPANAAPPETRFRPSEIINRQSARPTANEALNDSTEALAAANESLPRANRATAAVSGAVSPTEFPLAAPAKSAPPMLSTEKSVRVVDVMGEGKTNPVVSMYAAGIAVMFLLFGAAGGGGALLEERESQTLDRLLSTRLSMDQLLLGKWFYMTAIGVLQVSVMFLWGQIVFGVDLLGHFDGFVIMTVVTASAASAFGLFLATLCRTRGQLNGLSVILILTMSALGGSMVPRYVMSERLQEIGLWTFNAWALDGYDKVFWRELPVGSLSPQLAVLLACGMAFLVAARGLAVRWESD